ncbi:hypothetical protein ACHAWF_006898 [Thalassiosira exigua]
MPPAITINKQIKAFALLSLLGAIFNIVFHNYLFHSSGRNTLDDYQKNFHFSRTTRQEKETPEAIATAMGDSNGDCFKARKDTVPIETYGELMPPYFNLGFPKIGSSSIHSFFACAGYRAMHYRCKSDTICADCIKQSVQDGLPPFEKCGIADVYSQIDDGSLGHFAQIEYLEEIVRGIPNGTFFLTFRSMDKWYHSISNWPPGNVVGNRMVDGLLLADITGFPRFVGRNQSEFSQWFCSHVRRVRDLVAKDPSLTLVEIDIEDSDTGSQMADIFDVDASCWGRQNVNEKLHPEHNTTRHPWFVRGKRCVRGKTKMRTKKMRPIPNIPGMPPFNFSTWEC